MTRHYCDQCEAALSATENTYRHIRAEILAGGVAQHRMFCDYRCLAAWAARQR